MKKRKQSLHFLLAKSLFNKNVRLYIIHIFFQLKLYGFRPTQVKTNVNKSNRSRVVVVVVLFFL